MQQENKADRDVFVIDLKRIMEVLWKRVWLIILVSVLVAGMGFACASYFIIPQYSSSIMLYVNNSSVSIGNTSVSISSGQLSAAQSLVKTYIVLLKNRTTLEAVIEDAGVDYTYEQLSGMISASAVNETEVMRVQVTSPDPYEAASIANSIARVMPIRISEIIEGSSMKVVDSGVPNLKKVSPSVSRYTIIGFLLGFLLVAGVLVVLTVMDDTIHDEDYIVDTYSFPILAVVPDLLETHSGNYKKYYETYESQTKK